MPLLTQQQFLKYMGLTSAQIPIHCRPPTTVLFTVNGRDVVFPDAHEVSLLDFLRHDLWAFEAASMAVAWAFAGPARSSSTVAPCAPAW